MRLTGDIADPERTVVAPGHADAGLDRADAELWSFKLCAGQQSQYLSALPHIPDCAFRAY